MASDGTSVVRDGSTAHAAIVETDRQADAAGPNHDLEQAHPDDLPLDVLFELLKNRRRRRVLRYLDRKSSTVDLGTLAEALAAEENDTSPRALSSSERKRVYICLYQCHLPKLDDAGVIEFDSNRGTITKTPLVSDLLNYVERLRGLAENSGETETDVDKWPARYFRITFAGGGIYLLQAILFPSAMLSLILVGGLVFALLGASLTHLLGF